MVIFGLICLGFIFIILFSICWAVGIATDSPDFEFNSCDGVIGESRD